jgi:hypothetical protein
MPSGGPRLAPKMKSPLTRSTKQPMLRYDLRTSDGRLFKATVKELTEHVGGNPTPPQKILINRAANLTVVIEQLERKILATEGPPSYHSTRQFLAWTNSLRLILVNLGLDRKERAPARLAEVLELPKVKPERPGLRA